MLTPPWLVDVAAFQEEMPYIVEKPLTIQAKSVQVKFVIFLPTFLIGIFDIILFLNIHFFLFFYLALGNRVKSSTRSHEKVNGQKYRKKRKKKTKTRPPKLTTNRKSAKDAPK